MTKPSSTAAEKQPSRRGIMLLIVMVTVLLMSFAAYAFSTLMLSEYEAVKLSGKQVQARAMIDSGIDLIRVFLSQDQETQTSAGGVYDNIAAFQGVIIVDDPEPSERGAVTILAPGADDEGNPTGVRYGLEDESARLNLNALLLADEAFEEGGRNLLLGLPSMTVEVADAILDWLDEDDDPREFGAELDYYASLDPPYAPTNGPMSTVAELLLVKGVTPAMLFGMDVNRNHMIDPYEEEADLEAIEDGSPASMERGWSSYLTIYSNEGNYNALWQPRIYLNQTDMEVLFAEISERFDANLATFIVAYKQNGPYNGDQDGTPIAAGNLDLTKEGATPFINVLDLIDAKVRVTFEGEEDPTIIESPFKNDPGMGVYLPLIMDNFTVSELPYIPGRININQAPRTILEGIPGMTEELAQAIIDARAQFDPLDDNPNRKHETWLIAEAVLVDEEGAIDIETMKTLMPYVCAGGDVYRAQIVGYFQDGGASSRAEIVIDATTPEPRLLFWRDLSHLGRGYAIETLGLDSEEALE